MQTWSSAESLEIVYKFGFELPTNQSKEENMIMYKNLQFL